MNHNLSMLSLSELYDKLSEFTTLYSKSMINGFSEKEFGELRFQIEEIQKEIAKRKANSSQPRDGRSILPPQSPGA